MYVHVHVLHVLHVHVHVLHVHGTAHVHICLYNTFRMLFLLFIIVATCMYSNDDIIHVYIAWESNHRDAPMGHNNWTIQLIYIK